MLNVDIGGAKGSDKNLKYEWKKMDIRTYNCDYNYDLNSRLPFPFKDEEVDNYYSSHALYCTKLENIQFVFNEIYRTLKKEGRFRIVVIDLAVGMNLYLRNPKALSDSKYPKLHHEYPDVPMGRFLSWCGSEAIKTAIDRDMLKHYLEWAGFDKNNIKWMDYTKCSDVFTGKDRPRWQGWSIYAEVGK
jgi:predicted SAM-dependent methyltransferase